MEQVCLDLAARAEAIFSAKNDRVVIAIAGTPGSGKSTVCDVVAQLLNERAGDAAFAKVVPMDGFHLTRAQLDKFPDPVTAHNRRGSPATFDPTGLVEMVRKLGNPKHPISVPTFDHKLKDPVPNGMVVHSGTKIVLLEGLYLLLGTGPWHKITSIVDDRWFMTVDPQIARVRVARRHVEAGILPTMDAALERVDGNDAKNGKLVTDQSLTPQVIVDTGTNRITLV